MIYILDSNTLIAIFNSENGAQKVADIINSSSNDCFIHAVNLCEIYCGYRRHEGEQVAQSVIKNILDMKIYIREDLDIDFWKRVGFYKSELRKISLADCFCIALGERLKGTVLTCDHHEFEPVKSGKLVKVEFFR